MNQFDEFKTKHINIAIVGLGYVGLPLAVAFSKHFNVFGFDTNKDKINIYLSGIDPTGEVGNKILQSSNIMFTSDENILKQANFIIVAVPTPINGDKTPNLDPVKSATKIIGRNIKMNSIVVFESTVYPGVTEDICAKIIEEESGFNVGEHFKIAYSPERINPGDKVHRLHNIKKIVAGMDNDTLDIVANLYNKIIDVGVYRAPSIKVAEAAKLVENAQRDINIAFMNELAMVFDRMDIETNEVIRAMNTKWNALGFKPGLVGGHCIGVDPYYFIYKAEALGYNSQIIAAGRRINDGMSEFVVQAIIKEIIRTKIDISKAKIYLMGMTFKEDCPDTRNSRAIDVYKLLDEYGLNLFVVDPVANKDEMYAHYGIELISMDDVKDADCVVFLVGHKNFRELDIADLDRIFKKNNFKIIIDIKSIYDANYLRKKGYIYWSL